MSFRGGRGGGRGGRAGPGDGLNLAGMTYAEISGSGGKESEELFQEYPQPFPVLPQPTSAERAVVRRQLHFARDGALSVEWLRVGDKGDAIKRYSDRFKPATSSGTASLKREDYPDRDDTAHELWEGYFEPKNKRTKIAKKPKKKKKTLDDLENTEGAGLGDDNDDDEEEAGAGSDEPADDYEEDDEDDDYGDQYFDNGEDDEGGDDGGDGGEDGGTFD